MSAEPPPPPSQIGLRVSLDPRISPVPYRAETRDDGENHGYFDAKREPGRIAEIPEVQGWPEVEGFIRDLNSPGSGFRTIGCDAPKAQEQDGDHWIGSFIVICFDFWEMCRLEQYRELFAQYALSRVDDPPSQDEFVDIELCLRDWIDHGLRAWTALVMVNARAETQELARGPWAAELQKLRRYLMEESSGVARFAQQHGFARIPE